MPLILPETSSDIDTHQMSVLLSYQQSSGPGRSLNTELLEVNNFDQSYGNVDNIDSTTVNSLHAGKSVDKHDDGGADLNEKEFSKTQNIDVENWPSCNNSAMERANESIASNHPECDIDIEECDIIKNVSDNETPVCSNEMFNKNEISIPDIGQQADNDNTSFETENKESDTHVKTDEVQLNPRTSEPNDLDILLQSPLSPPPPPIGPPEGLRNVQDATEYHKPTLLGKNIKVKKHAKLQICRQCDQVFSNRQALIRHIERRHKNFTLNHSCDTCHKKFNSERTLNQHMRSHKTYPCKLCSKIFLKKQKLKKHMEDHSQKNLSCKICGREAGSMPALISHVKSHERLPKNFTCSVCSKHFTCKRNLEQHTLIHSGEKPFSCENCGRVFRNRSNMVNHFNICTGKYRFTCSLCGKGFVLKSQYERHLGEHEGRYAHCCSICQKGFSKSSDLRIHFNTHEIALQAHTKLCTVCTNQEFGCNAANIKETKTVCEICGKHINKKSTMKDHLAFHAGKRNYECHICSMSYFYKSNLTFHIKSYKFSLF
ncbi:Zinc finger protein 26 [Armadillidium vulgare]|nr:Zinc finger protein 26 [Armadillidium vulgare]